MFVCPSTWDNSAPKGRISMKFDTSIFRKYVEKIQVSLKCDRNSGYFTWIPMYMYDNISLRNISDKSFIGNQNRHFMINKFFSENRAVYEVFRKIRYSQTGHRWQYDMQHAHYVQVKSSYRQNFKMCNDYQFSTATMAARTRLSVTVHVNCLVCYCTYFVKRGHPQNISFTGEAGRWLHFTESKCFKKCEILQLSWLFLK